ncbi:YiiX/YebB-like N1pC/P60 family cysteine hydrolase [Marinobacter lacisalsi]|uniref:YiiX/YebB-like N1pC/P60 family cysteine hydrolase n=1 Tax=Marinobacter lacisalsi TaxID=475979 RepID=A0ABV8QHC3_9GAMM
MKTQTASPNLHAEPTLIEPLSLASLDLIEVGDIIATASNASTSEGIQWATNAEFSHAILYLRDGMAVDAMPGVGVRTQPLLTKLKGASRAVVFRHRNATREQKALAVNWAAAQVGAGYDNVGAARVGLQFGSRTFPLRLTPIGHTISVVDEIAGAASDEWHDSSFFCSELIFRAYEVAQAPIVPGRPHVAGPGALRKVRTVRCVGELTLVA